MLEKIKFNGKNYKLVITYHAQERMKQRGISRSEVLNVLKTGIVKKKDQENRWWIYKRMRNRFDNFLCLSAATEDPCLIVITALVNWSPEV